MMFEIYVKPTPEQHTFTINGVDVPLRVWVGQTSGGLPVEVYVLAIVPDPATPELADRLRAELPPFMLPARDVYYIGGMG